MASNTEAKTSTSDTDVTVEEIEHFDSVVTEAHSRELFESYKKIYQMLETKTKETEENVVEALRIGDTAEAERIKSQFWYFCQLWSDNPYHGN